MKFVYFMTEGTEPHFDERDRKVSISEISKLAKQVNADRFIFRRIEKGEYVQLGNKIVWQEEA